MNQIEQIIDVETAEYIRFYGSIVGTPGISEEIITMCNDNIKKLLNVLQPKIQRHTAGKAGIIT